MEKITKQDRQTKIQPHQQNNKTNNIHRKKKEMGKKM